ncbi:MAG TPA: right-handed parallel beta-helix repeat-containing protein [Silvibacterium sp.]|nr:right-handed parallel beta-helix repeat-containing protein [Silvibacterium sp.]
MTLKNILGAVAVMACMIPGIRTLAQANINENQSHFFYVNGSWGSNSNPGTSSSRPLKTIQAAVNKAISYAKSGIGTKVMISPGTYRETVTLNYRSNVPITLQADSAGSVFIDGSDVLHGWWRISSPVYGFTWRDTVSGCGLPSGWYGGMPPVVQANQMLFVNNVPMTQVMSSSQLHPGTFYDNTSGNEIEVDPPSGTDMTTAQVEISARKSTLVVDGSKNLVFRGLVFQHAASCMNETGATVGSSSEILFTNDQAKWNNWGGLGVNNSTNVTVENTVANYNGGPGIEGYEDLYSLWQYNESDYNNWRGAQAALYDFAQGGTKLMRAHSARIIGQKSYNNASQGLWFDTDNTNITIDNAKLVGNLVGNLQLEANEGPVTVENSTFCSGGGVQMINTANITMTGNVFYNNGGQSFQNGQLFLAGNAGGRKVTNWQTGSVTNVYTKNTKLFNNSFLAIGSNQYVFNTYLSGNDWGEYIGNLDSNSNHWYNPYKSAAFSLPGGKTTTLGGWRSVSQQDDSSVWASAANSCGIPTTAYPDFQLLAHNAASYVSSYTMSGGVIRIPLNVRSFRYGTVHLTASGMPSGVSASFSSAYLTSGNSTLTLHASSSARWETVYITVFGAAGNRVHTITFKVNVRPA